VKPSTRSNPRPGRGADGPGDVQGCAAEGIAAPPRPARPTNAELMLPPELLQTGETIILLLKPSPWFIVLSCLGWLAGVGVMTVAALEIQNRAALDLSRREIVVLGVAVAAARLLWQFLEWLSRTYVLTDRRVIRVQGVLRVNVFECPLHRIQHTSLIFSLRERLFTLGTLGFATAGTGITEAAWQMISRPLEHHQTVVKTINRHKGTC